MCDYSLHDVQSRPAQVGDKLIISNFRNSITRGLAAVGEPNMAVCLLPGTEIAFDRKVEADPIIPFLRKRNLGAQVARFCQIRTDSPNAHHDALEFPNGKVVLLTRLSKGQQATVLQLPATHRGEKQPHLRKATLPEFSV
jgi:hypothetical protein